MTPRAQYSYGLQLGARPKAAPEYIGATARASRRRARLAELDRLIADLGRQREDLAAQRQRVLDLLADLGRAQQELPQDRAGHRGARPGHQRRGAADRRRAPGSPGRRKRWTGPPPNWTPGPGGSGTPPPTGACPPAPTRWTRSSVRSPTSRVRPKTWSAPAGTWPRSSRICSNAWTASAISPATTTRPPSSWRRTRPRTSPARRSSASTSGPAARSTSRSATRSWTPKPAVGRHGPTGRRPAQRQNEAHDKVVGAERDLSHGRSALAAAMGELVTQAAAFEPYTQGDLRPLLEVTESAPWPAAGQWPDPQRVGDELVDRLMAGDERRLGRWDHGRSRSGAGDPGRAARRRGDRAGRVRGRDPRRPRRSPKGC